MDRPRAAEAGELTVEELEHAQDRFLIAPGPALDRSCMMGGGPYIR